MARLEPNKWYSPEEFYYGKKKKMKIKNNAIGMLAMDAKAYGVRYKTNGQVYTFGSLFEVNIGDNVVVDGIDGFTVAEVVENDLEFDVDAEFEYKFIVGIIDLRGYEQAGVELELMMKKVKKLKAKAVQEQIFEKLGITKQELLK